MILGHHSYGEEMLAYAVAGGSAAVPTLVLLWRIRLARLVTWLRRR
jgi:hypothetical protein